MAEYLKEEKRFIQVPIPNDIAEPVRELENKISEAIKEFNEKTNNEFEISIECAYKTTSSFAGNVKWYDESKVILKLIR